MADFEEANVDEVEEGSAPGTDPKLTWLPRLLKQSSQLYLNYVVPVYYGTNSNPVKCWS